MSVKVKHYRSMTIGELAAATGASNRALRHYEAEGLLQSTRAANGYRMYGDDAIAAVEHIRRLIASGLTARTIREILPCVVMPLSESIVCERTRSILEREHERLEQLMGKIAHSKTLLEMALGPNS